MIHRYGNSIPIGSEVTATQLAMYRDTLLMDALAMMGEGVPITITMSWEAEVEGEDK